MQHYQSFRTKPTKIKIPLKLLKKQEKIIYNTNFNFPKHLKEIPLVIDSSGRWDRGLNEFVKKIAKYTAGPDDFKYNDLDDDDTLAVDNAKTCSKLNSISSAGYS